MQSVDEAAPAAAARERPGTRAEPGGGVLFRRYAAVLMGLVGGALALLGAVDLAFDYQATRAAAEQVQRAEARAAASRIEQYLAGIERQLAEVSALPWSPGRAGLKERRDEYHRLMKLVPAVSEVRAVQADGAEVVRASRVAPDEYASGREWRGTRAFEEALARGRHASPTFFREGSEPFMVIATRDRGGGHVTLAEINLRYVGEVVEHIRIGARGIVYVVDGANHVVAHPDAAVVLRKTDLTGYAPVAQLRAGLEAGAEGGGMLAARAFTGAGEVMLSAARIPSARWLVVAEQPAEEVLGPVYRSLARTLAALLAGIAAALAVAWLLARRLARPILEVRAGASRIARGDLATRIEVATGDDVELLARDFNRMADQLQEYTGGLERKVAEKTAELEAANRHKSEFLANMSHELRTPLNAVIGFSEALRERWFGELNPKQTEYVNDIHASGQHLLSLINDILDLAKVESGRMELDARAFDVEAAVANCVTLVRERALRHSLRLRREVEPGLRLVADERKFKQVLLNLLSNAVKFTPAGGEISVDARREGAYLVVRVRDSGAGIARADLEAIFEAFTQLRGAGRMRQEGTGLGLPLARRMVELHGGTLEVESEPGTGSTFIARFPHREGD